MWNNMQSLYWHTCMYRISISISIYSIYDCTAESGCPIHPTLNPAIYLLDWANSVGGGGEKCAPPWQQKKDVNLVNFDIQHSIENPNMQKKRIRNFELVAVSWTKPDDLTVLNPTQLAIHGQWWSIRSTQELRRARRHVLQFALTSMDGKMTYLYLGNGGKGWLLL